MEEKKQGLLTKIKNLFSKKKDDKEDNQEVVFIKPEERKVRDICFFCNEYIYEDEHYSKQMNHIFHRKCYKKFIQSGRANKLKR